jgi:hypothetical protein
LALLDAAPDRHTGLASGVRDAVASAAGLMAVAALGTVASLAFASIAGDNLPGIEFGAPDGQPLRAIRIAVHCSVEPRIPSDRTIASAMCFLAALTAWFTQPSGLRQPHAALSVVAAEV